MTKNRLLCFIGISSIAFSLIATLTFSRDFEKRLIFADSTVVCNHSGFHYNYVNPTDTEAGHREFWTCCNCQRQWLAKPQVGTFVDASDSTMIGGLDSNHIAYLGTASKWDGTNVTAPGEGSGTEADPYLIYTAKELAYYAIKNNQVDGTTHLHLNDFYKKHYKLMNNIDLDNRDWKRFGNSKYSFFSGVFDGNGYSILNYKNSNTVCYSGFFGYVLDGEIKNLSVSGSVESASSSFMDAILVGVMHKSVIDNCVTFGSVSSGTNSAGGLVGKVNKVDTQGATNHTESSITNCKNYASVTLKAPLGSYAGSVGGIVGYACATDKLTISSCTNYGAVSNGAAGGILGLLADTSLATTIIDCVNVGVVSGSDIAGGIVGFVRAAANANISNSTNYADVSVTSGMWAGGLCGILRASLSYSHVGSNVKVQGQTVSAGRPTGEYGAFVYQVDSANYGVLTDCTIVSPLI